MPFEDQSWIERVDWLAQLGNMLLHALFNNIFLVAILLVGAAVLLWGYANREFHARPKEEEPCPK